jgi:hypothetical protein
MQRITTLLKESEADAVRNAVCIGGGKMIVITPVPRSHDAWQWRDGQGAAQREDFVRLEVMSDECHSNGVISAIKKTSNSGKIILVFNQDRGLNQAS